jgi:NTE family protein
MDKISIFKSDANSRTMNNIPAFLDSLLKDEVIVAPGGNPENNTKALLAVADKIWNEAISDSSDAGLKNHLIMDGGGNPVINPSRIGTVTAPEMLPGNIRVDRPIADLVQQGGAMLGIALVGYTYIMEKAGIRFYSLGGTSAGGINTVLLGAFPQTIYQQPSPFDPARQAYKSEMLAHIIANGDFARFMDRPGIIGRLQKMLFSNVRPQLFKWLALFAIVPIIILSYWLFGGLFTGANGLTSAHVRWFDFFVAISSLLVPFVLYYVFLIRILGCNFGINTGNYFYNWAEKILHNPFVSIRTTADLDANMQALSFTGKVPGKDKSRMVLISANLTHNRVVKFPERAVDYWGKDASLVSPAAYLRATMSLPFIFEAFIPDPKHFAQPPVEPFMMYARFVDGGMLSNFPIREFHVDKTPRFPTFGVLLSENPIVKPKPKAGNNVAIPLEPLTLFGHILTFIDTFRNFYDNDFLASNDEIAMRVETVETKSFNALDFWMKDKEKQQLFEEGARAAVRQLAKFDWNQYLNVRI